jgi:DNA replication ATP-dependent helicase Dna2
LGPDAARDVVADTVERMQGQERELIILSLASGDEVFLGAVAEFFFQPQRLNVSITRAKSKLIVIGPQPAAVPKLETSHLRRWIGQYLDFLKQLARVEL